MAYGCFGYGIRCGIGRNYYNTITIEEYLMLYLIKKLIMVAIEHTNETVENGIRKLIAYYHANNIWTYVIALVCAAVYYFDLNVAYALDRSLFGLIGYQLSHASLGHLVGNMFVFVLVGPDLENKYGKLRFLLLFFGTGIASALGFLVFNPDSTLIGASGAIAGLMALYAFTRPTLLGVLVTGLALFGVFFSDFASVLNPGFGNTAYLGHIAGGVAGLVCGNLFKHSS